MIRRNVLITAVTVAAAILIAGILLEPRLTARTSPEDSNANTPTGDTNPNPSPNPAAGTNASVPAWHAGDWWNYSVRLADGHERGPALEGWVLKSVAGTEDTSEGTAYNVTVTASYRLSAGLSKFEDEPTAFHTAKVSGYVLYRTSDLALIQEAFAVRFEGTYPCKNASVSVIHETKTWASFTPALQVWQFPLEENATWNATSNVSMGMSSSFSVTLGNETYTSNRSASATFRVALVMRSGLLGNVSVPAGNFTALPVKIAAAKVPYPSDRLTNEVLNATQPFEKMPCHPLAALWYAPEVRNVVKADTWLGPRGDLRLEMDLVAYGSG
jgi:hypothetical protein